MMRFVIWIANHALWISLIGAVCAIVVRFEKFFPRWLHTSLLFVSLFVTFATPLLGMLKKSLDDQWKTRMQQQIESALKAAQPKPFKERLKAFFDSVDPAILVALRNGNTKFHGFFYQDQLGALRVTAFQMFFFAVFAFAAALAFGLVARAYPVADHYRVSDR
jgi:hypothetical protein